MQTVSIPPKRNKVAVDTNKIGKTDYGALEPFEMQLKKEVSMRKPEEGDNQSNKCVMTKLRTLANCMKKLCTSQKINWTTINLRIQLVKKKINKKK